MDVAQDISKRGFKRWYEHRLIHAHAYLVTCFLCMILVATLLEEYSIRWPLMSQVLTLGIVAVAGALGIVSWLRYRVQFALAEHFADRSTCEACGAYARFEVTASRQGEDEDAGTWLRVRCRKCRHEWTIT